MSKRVGQSTDDIGFDQQYRNAVRKLYDNYQQNISSIHRFVLPYTAYDCLVGIWACGKASSSKVGPRKFMITNTRKGYGLAAIALHIGAALFHHYLRRDTVLVHMINPKIATRD